MTPTTLSAEGCSPNTRTFVIGDAQPASGSARRDTTVAVGLKQPVAKGSTLSSFMQELKLSDPGLDDKLATARKRLAGQLTAKTSLRSLRMAKGLSQAELAKAIGTSQPHMSRIESDPEAIMFITAIKLAEVLAVDIGLLASLIAEGIHEKAR